MTSRGFELWCIRDFSRSQNSTFTRMIKLKLTYLVSVCISCRCSKVSSLRSLSLKIFAPVIKDEKVGNIDRHRGTKSLLETAVNLSKLGPAPNFFQTPFLQSMFDIPCSIRFRYFSVFVNKRRFCGLTRPATSKYPLAREGSGHLTPNSNSNSATASLQSR